MRVFSSNPVPDDDAEVHDSQESIPRKKTEALQCPTCCSSSGCIKKLLTEMLAAIQTAKDMISIMRTSKLIQKLVS